MKLELTKTYDTCVSNEPKLTVVLIHGIASDSSTYNKALDFFREDKALADIRFVTFDLLGSGKSPKGDDLEYDYKEQTTALDNSIHKLDIKTPLVLVGHSLGTFIVTKYAREHKKVIAKLVLISPPVYTEQDFDNPLFEKGIEAFKQAVSVKNPEILKEKAFTSSMDKIVLQRENYQRLAGIDLPTILIYGDEDQLIASYNIPAMVKKNERMSAIRTAGRHGVSQDKFTELAKILKEMLNAESL